MFGTRTKKLLTSIITFVLKLAKVFIIVNRLIFAGKNRSLPLKTRIGFIALNYYTKVEVAITLAYYGTEIITALQGILTKGKD
jgi:hypothetical protein